MEISEKLWKFRFHITAAIALSLLFVSLIYVAPRFLEVLAYFWPLLVSTALFLVAVLLFNRTSPLATESHGEKAAEGLLDYVAGLPEQLVQPPPDAGGFSGTDHNM